MGVEAFLFDIGNVIVRFDYSLASAKYAERSNIEEDPIESISDLYVELERGDLTGIEFADRSIDRLGFDGTTDEFIEICEDIFTPNDPVWDLVRKVEGRFPLYLLSNISEIHHKSLFRDHEIFKSFDSGIFSYEARSLKPELSIYEKAIELVGISGIHHEKVIYIDDLEANCVAGKNAGFEAFLYRPDLHGELLDFLKSKNLTL